MTSKNKKRRVLLAIVLPAVLVLVVGPIGQITKSTPLELAGYVGGCCVATFVLGTRGGLRPSRNPRQRELDFPGFAAKLGLSYSPEDSVGVVNAPFDALHRGRHQAAANVLSGTWKGMEVQEFDFRYVVQGANQTQRMEGNVVLARLPVSAPDVIIHYRGFLQTGEVGGLLSPQVRFESEEFNESYVVRSADPRFATALVDDRMMAWLLGLDPGNRFRILEISGDHMLCLVSGFLPLPAISGLLDTTKEFHDHVPQVLGSMYPEAPPPPAPTA